MKCLLIILLSLLMTGCCNHHWIKEAETYAYNPRVKITGGGGFYAGAGPSLTEEALFGLTTIIFRCTKCNEIRREEMLGKAEK